MKVTEMVRLKPRPKVGLHGRTMVDMEIEVREILADLKRGRDTYSDVCRRLAEHYKTCPRVNKE